MSHKELETVLKKRTQNINKYIVYINNPQFRNPCVTFLTATSYLQHKRPFVCDYKRTGFIQTQETLRRSQDKIDRRSVVTDYLPVSRSVVFVQVIERWDGERACLRHARIHASGMFAYMSQACIFVNGYRTGLHVMYMHINLVFKDHCLSNQLEALCGITTKRSVTV